MAIALLIAAAVVVAAAGCGGNAAARSDEMAIVVTSRDYPEEKLLREIYAQALEAADFQVVRRDSPRFIPPEELERGIVSGYPDHLESALIEVAKASLEDVPGSPRAAYQKAKELLGGKGLVAFPPAPFERSSAVALRRTTADELGLKTLSDLEGPAGRMSVVSGEYFCYCYGRACMSSLEGDYGIVFEGFSTSKPPERLYNVLQTGKADAGMVIASEGDLARRRKWLVVLEDDRHRLPASNALWLTRQDVVDALGPGYERAIVTAQAGLTLETMRELNAEVELGGRPPDEVAADYLRSIDLEEHAG